MHEFLFEEVHYETEKDQQRSVLRYWELKLKNGFAPACDFSSTQIYQSDKIYFNCAIYTQEKKCADKRPLLKSMYTNSFFLLNFADRHWLFC